MLLNSIVGRSILYKLLADVAGRVTSFLVVVTVAHRLGTRATGIYALAFSLGAYITVFSDLGMHLFLTREIAAGRSAAERLIGSLFLLKIAINAAVGVAVSAAILFFLPWDEETRMVLIIAWATLCYSFVEFLTAVLRGYNAIIEETSLVLIFRLARTAVGIAMIWIFKDLISFALAVALLTVLAAAGSSWYVVRRWGLPQFSFSWKEVKHWVGEYLPIGAGLVITLLYWRSDVFLIRFFLTPVEVGLYDAAYRAFDAVQVFPAITLAVLYPRFAAPGGLRYFWHAVRGLEILALSLMASVFFGGELFLRLAYGRAFEASAPILKILFLALPLMFANAILINYLIANRRQGTYVLAASLAFLFKASINLWAIPKFGISAAAVAAVLTEFVILAVCLAGFLVHHKDTKTGQYRGGVSPRRTN
ncbi:MAG TPA: flippase [Acidobacteriota bacterium]|jgi:O-antigen/teichoic acid export membrane protein